MRKKRENVRQLKIRDHYRLANAVKEVIESDEPNPKFSSIGAATAYFSAILQVDLGTSSIKTALESIEEPPESLYGGHQAPKGTALAQKIQILEREVESLKNDVADIQAILTSNETESLLKVRS